jgi:hypothetical protein
MIAAESSRGHVMDVRTMRSGEVRVDASRPQMRHRARALVPAGAARRSQGVVPPRWADSGDRCVRRDRGVTDQHLFRDLEAAAAARLYSVVRPTLAAPGAPIIWFGLGNPGAFGLVITPDCSSAL